MVSRTSSSFPYTRIAAGLTIACVLGMLHIASHSKVVSFGRLRKRITHRTGDAQNTENSLYIDSQISRIRTSHGDYDPQHDSFVRTRNVSVIRDIQLTRVKRNSDLQERDRPNKNSDLQERDGPNKNSDLQERDGPNKNKRHQGESSHRHNQQKPRNKKRRRGRRRNKNKERKRARSRANRKEQSAKNSEENEDTTEMSKVSTSRTSVLESEFHDDPVDVYWGQDQGQEGENDGDYYTYDYFKEGNRFASNKKQRRKGMSKISENDSGPRDYSKLFLGSDFGELGSPDLTRQNPNIEVAIEILHETYSSDKSSEEKGPNDFPVGKHEDIEPDGVSEETGHTGSSRGRNKGGQDMEESESEDDALVTGDDNTDEIAGRVSTQPDFTDHSVSSQYEFPYSDAEKDDVTEVLPNGDNERGGTGQWGEWSACSVTCGGGNKRRQRSCGNSCTSTETQDCQLNTCPDASDTDGFSSGGLVGILTHVADLSEVIEHDSCEAWMTCRSERLLAYVSKLQELPSCPCFYPTNIPYNDSIWDPQKQKLFRWMDASGEQERLDIYRPMARYCIRSRLPTYSTSLAAQHCCYDDEMRLITRGSGAGTPDLISTEVSRELHYKIDIMPWINCKGDWTRYNQIRQPNNMRGCTELPDTAEFIRQYRDAKNY